MKLVCLACSHRPGGRCIAGIDLETGQWVRPVPGGDDAIREERCTVGGKPLSVLDVLKIDVGPLRETPRYQRENRSIRNWSWSIVGRMRAADLDSFVESDEPYLHTPGDRTAPAQLDRLPPEQWRSLQLIRPRGLAFEPDRWNKDPFVPNRWRARFRDSCGNQYVLIVTDPQATQRLERGETFGENVLLTISLTRPYAGGVGKPPMCYKVAAAVIELDSQTDARRTQCAALGTLGAAPERNHVG